MTAYGEAFENIRGKNTAPTNQEELLTQKAENKMQEAIKKINTFFTDKWKAYQTLVENNKVNLFKEFKQL